MNTIDERTKNEFTFNNKTYIAVEHVGCDGCVFGNSVYECTIKDNKPSYCSKYVRADKRNVIWIEQ